MTQEERIKKLEDELLSLRKELSRNKKINVWREIKSKFETEFNSFDWEYVHTTTDCNENPVEFRQQMTETYNISQALGTLVRIALKRRGLNYLEEDDKEKAEMLITNILKILKEGGTKDEKKTR